MKKLSAALLMLALAACGTADVPVDEAALFVARDLLAHAPEGFAAYLGGEWETGSRVPDPIEAELVARLGEGTGLPVLGAEMIEAQTSPVAVLYLFRPQGMAGDTVRVTAGWLDFPGLAAEPVSGSEYVYLLSCPAACVLLERTGPGPLS
jgi:hypothetical protein